MTSGIAGLGRLATPVIDGLGVWIQLHERANTIETAGMLRIGEALALLAAPTPRDRAAQV